LRFRKRCRLPAVLPIFALLSGCGAKLDKDDEAKKPTVQHSEAKRDDEPFVQLTDEGRKLAGIQTQALVLENVTPQIVAYGKLEEDPSESFVLRAPIAGNLHASAARAWPGLGETVRAGTVLGSIEPRFTPSERIALNTQLAAARFELSASNASLEGARSAFQRARVLNADDKNVSDRVLQEAETRLRSEEARQKAASDTLRVLTSTQPGSQTAGRPLIVERTGDVVELTAHPGEAVEPGVTILRVARLDRLLARIDAPVGERVTANISTGFVKPAGFEDEQPLRASRIAFGASADPKSPGASFLFRLNGTRFGLRPGLPVTAYLAAAGKTRQGVVIPSSAVVRVSARPFVYLQTKPGRYERRAILLDQPAGSGYLAASGFAAGDRVVSVGAQTLLSEELKAQLKGDDDH